jgi:hypothetical protein
VLKNRNQYDNDSDNDLNLSNFNKHYVNGINDNGVKSLNGEAPKLTFEQYVKKLTGTCALAKTLSPASVTSKIAAAAASSLKKKLDSNCSLKVTATPSQKSIIPQSKPQVAYATVSPMTQKTIVSSASLNSLNNGSSFQQKPPQINLSVINPNMNSSGINQSFIITKPPQQQSINISNPQPNLLDSNVKLKTISEATNENPTATAATPTPTPTATPTPTTTSTTTTTTSTTTSTLNSNINLSISASPSVQHLTANKKFVIINPTNPTTTTTPTTMTNNNNIKNISTTTTTTISPSPMTNTQTIKVPQIIQTTNQPNKIISISQFNGIIKPHSSISAPTLINKTINSNQIRTQILSPILNRPQVVMINTNTISQNKVISTNIINNNNSNLTLLGRQPTSIPVLPLVASAATATNETPTVPSSLNQISSSSSSSS